MAEWADAWLANLKRIAAAGTLRKRRSDLRRHVLPYLGNQELTALTPASLTQWWADLDATPGARKTPTKPCAHSSTQPPPMTAYS